MKTKLLICYICVEGLGLSHASSLVGGSDSVSSCRFSCSLLDLSASFNLSSPSSTRFHELHPMFDMASVCFQQLLGEIYQRTVTLGSCLQV